MGKRKGHIGYTNLCTVDDHPSSCYPVAEKARYLIERGGVINYIVKIEPVQYLKNK